MSPQKIQMRKDETRQLEIKENIHNLTVVSVSALYCLCAVGICITGRPGLPSVSRILADNPTIMPNFYILFCVVSSIDSLLLLAEIKATTQLYLGILQSIFIFMIVVADMDFNYYLHFSSATMIVVVGFIRGLVVAWQTNGRTRIYQIIMLGVILACSGMFVLYNYFYANAELTTSVALTEYALFLTIAANYALYISP